MGRVRRKRPIRDAAASVESMGYAVSRAARAGERLANATEVLVEKLQDGVDVEFVFADDFNWLDLVSGKVKTLPVKMRVIP